MPGDWKRKWKPDEGGHVPLTPSYGLGRKLMAWHARAALLTIKLVPQVWFSSRNLSRQTRAADAFASTVLRSSIKLALRSAALVRHRRRYRPPRGGASQRRAPPSYRLRQRWPTANDGWVAVDHSIHLRSTASVRICEASAHSRDSSKASAHNQGCSPVYGRVWGRCSSVRRPPGTPC
jgi:hypothetical protein